jgi:hypothetical protein
VGRADVLFGALFVILCGVGGYTWEMKQPN